MGSVNTQINRDPEETQGSCENDRWVTESYNPSGEKASLE
jgi:hypothetical protein